MQREVFGLSANGDAAALERRVREIYANELEQYYDAPIDWLIAAVELQSDEAFARAIVVFDLWADLHTDHLYTEFARIRAVENAITIADANLARDLFGKLEAVTEDADELQRLTEEIAALEG